MEEKQITITEHQFLKAIEIVVNSISFGYFDKDMGANAAEGIRYIGVDISDQAGNEIANLVNDCNIRLNGIPE